MKTHPLLLTRDFLRLALAALWLPFSRPGALPVTAISRLRRAQPAHPPADRDGEHARIDTGSFSLELLKRLEWRRFEDLVAAYFAALGFTPQRARTPTDGAAVIGLRIAGTEQAAIVVHCRAWNAYRVGIKSVHALRAAMAAAGAGEGVLVTPGRFTREAESAAGKANIRLVDGADLLAKIAALSPERGRALLELATQGDFLTPTCPCCAVKMVARQSTAGGRRFWGCPNYPKCKEIVFGSTPG
jgi:restriction system protein